MTQTDNPPETHYPSPVLVPTSAPKPYMRDLRRVRDSVPWRLWVVALIGFWERAAFWGLLAPWQNYMEHPPAHEVGQKPGALGLGQEAATRAYCCFYIFYYVSPIFLAIVADSRLGQYTSLLISVILYCLGIVALTISSIPANIDKGWGVPGLVIAMFLIGLGGGGVKAILPPFLADQYTKTQPRLKTLKTGEQVVTDYDLTLQYIYNLYFWIGNIGSLSWFGTVFIEKHYGFTGAYGLTLGLMVIVLLMLILGKDWYVKVSHKENLIVPQVTKILVCAVRHGFKMKRADPDYQHQCYHKTVSWTGQMVDELTKGLRGCRVLLAFVMFYVCFDQMQNNLISQAGQLKMDGTPNDLLPALNQVGCIIMGPLIQMGLYPFLHRRRIYIGPIMRTTIGFSFMTLSMLYATIVQNAIYSSPPCYDNVENCAYPASGDNLPNVWIQAPVYFLISTGEIFSYVTGLEYAYDHSPMDMKVIVQAISLLIGGIGSTIALALTAIAHDPNLVIFYASLTGGMLVTTVVFSLIFRKYDKSQVDTDQQQSKANRLADVEKDGSLQEDKDSGAESAHMKSLSASVLTSSDTAQAPTCSHHEHGTNDEIVRLQSASDTTLVPTVSEDYCADLKDTPHSSPIYCASEGTCR